MSSRSLNFLAFLSTLAALALPGKLGAQQQQGQDATPLRYKLIDLGTFGGPNSFFAGPQPPAPNVNNKGLAIGGAETPALDPYYPNCFIDCFVSHAFKWEGDALIDLGVLPGGSSSLACCVSASGRITGFSQNGLIDPLTGFPEDRAVIWTRAGQILDLGTLGGNESISSDINDRGQVVGIAANQTLDPFSFFGWGTQTRGFLWQDGVMHDMGTLGGPDAFAVFINSSGQVAGISYAESTANPSTGIPTIHPFLWKNGNMQDLGSLGGLGTPGNSFNEGFSVEVNSLNDRGEVVGTSPLAGDQTYHAFLWSGGFLRDLGTLGGNNSKALWISDSGLVVGRADFSPQSTAHHAFLWKNGVMTDLGTLGLCQLSTAVVVNSKGQAVGDTGGCPGGGEGPPFLSDHGEAMVDLNTLVLPGSDLTLTGATFINDRGEIAGAGVLPNGDQHAVLLVPASEAEIAAAEALSVQPRANTVQPPSSRSDSALNRFRRTRQLP